jgi:hypothetical protein
VASFYRPDDDYIDFHKVEIKIFFNFTRQAAIIILRVSTRKLRNALIKNIATEVISTRHEKD